MLFSRETGLLLHPTSLPGRWGIGTLGSEARQLADWMTDSGVTVWQVLPLSPPVYSNSPYQALSSFAGNPLLISPECLFRQGLLSQAELDSAEIPASDKVSWERLTGRTALLELASERALRSDPAGFDEFSKLEWVKQWSRFMARKAMNKGKAWPKWKDLSTPSEHSVQINSMIQFFFCEQWQDLKKYCNTGGIRILGDIPIYTAHDSTDVFFNRSNFKLNKKGIPSVVAGVPPDYFSSTGQLWGNPVYNWENCSLSGYNFWTERMKRALELFDAVRIDHFRGFSEYWEIPYGESTAINGSWVNGPGVKLFKKMEQALGKLPVVAEDLGLITESVVELRKQCGFPGMLVLHFALQNPDFSIHLLDPATVLYTGTHDNDTSVGWIESIGRTLGIESVSSLVSIALESPAVLTVLPMQDILELNSGSRMNTPSTESGNWSWRMIEFPGQRRLSRST